MVGGLRRELELFGLIRWCVLFLGDWFRARERSVFAGTHGDGKGGL